MEPSPFTFTEMDVTKLKIRPECVAVTIYLPTHIRWVDTQKDKIILKKLLKEIEKKVKNCRDVLDPVYDLLSDDTFWKAQKGGLAIFAGRGVFEYEITNKKLEERYFIGKDFELSYLESATLGLPSYYILVLSPKRSALYLVENDNLVRVAEDVIPSSGEEVWAIDNPEKSIQHHVTTPAMSGGTVFHGHGGGVEYKDVKLGRFLSYIDKKVNEVVVDKNYPLVLACVDSLWHKYKSITLYSNLSEVYIPGNPDNLSDLSLLKESRKIFDKNSGR